MRFSARAVLLVALCATAAACTGSPSDQAGARPTAVVTASPSERTEPSPADQDVTDPPPVDSTTGRAPDPDPVDGDSDGNGNGNGDGDGDPRPRMPVPGNTKDPRPGQRETPPPENREAPPPGNPQAPPPNPQAPPPGNPRPNPPPQGPPPAKPPPMEKTDAPLPGSPRNPGPRTVEVSGPTIDNRYQAEPLSFERPGVLCNPYTNGAIVEDPDAAEVPVTIRDIDIANQVPGGTPVFQVVTVDTALCAGPEAFDFVGNCPGATLPPFTEEQPSACALGLSFSAGTDHYAEVIFSLEVACINAEASPCDEEQVRVLAPTPAAPVTVRWSSSESVEACPEHPPAGGGGECPGGPDGDD